MKRIQDLEAEIKKFTEQRNEKKPSEDKVAVPVPVIVKQQESPVKAEKEKSTTVIQEVAEVNEEKQEISSMTSDDVGSPTDKEDGKQKSSSDQIHELECATDLNKLKEDMDWINLQIEKETPMKA